MVFLLRTTRMGRVSGRFFREYEHLFCKKEGYILYHSVGVPF